MEVLVRISDEVMMTMMCRPPERPSLIRRRSGERDQKLKNSTRPVGAMRQQTMKAGGNRKHAHNIKSEAGYHCDPTHARPDDQETGQVQKKELCADGIMEFVVIKRTIAID
jgi:hypothetical protein